MLPASPRHASPLAVVLCGVSQPHVVLLAITTQCLRIQGAHAAGRCLTDPSRLHLTEGSDQRAVLLCAETPVPYTNSRPPTMLALPQAPPLSQGFFYWMATADARATCR
jgi:hypothetical protein